jgi:hypothetical protein
MKIQATQTPVRAGGRPQASMEKNPPQPTSKGTTSTDKVSLSRPVKKAIGFGKGALVGLLSGGMALAGTLLGNPGVGFLLGTATSTVASGLMQVDEADRFQDSAQTGALFGIVSSGMSTTLGIPGMLAGGLISGVRWTLGS